jgi:hypothetical protein
VNWWESGMKSWEWSQQSNDFLAQSVSQLDCHVLVSLHPKQDRKNYQYIETKFPRFKILDESLSDVLTVADLYYTGFGSSVIMWAIMLSIPVVIANHYAEKETFFGNLDGVVYVDEETDLATTLHRSMEDNNYQKLYKSQQKASQQYCILDAESMNRIVNFILTRNPAIGLNEND